MGRILFRVLLVSIVSGAIAASSAVPGHAAGESLATGGMLSGVLRLVHTHRPDGTAAEAYQIVSEPRQMKAGDDVCVNPDAKPTTFHLFTQTKSDRVVLSRLIGKKVRVRVWELFCSQTAWHVGDVAVNKWSWQ